MIIGLRTPRFPLTLKLFGFHVSKQDHLLDKNIFFQPLPLIDQTKRCIRKYKLKPNAALTMKSTSSSVGTPAPHASYVQELKESKAPSPKTSTHVSPNFRGFIFSRYKNFTRNYEKAMKNVPVAFQRYRNLYGGIIDFYKDMKWYLTICRTVRNSPDALRTLNLKELDLYMQMPKDMLKLIPTMIGVWIPIIGYAVCALVLMYPRILTTHFWTPQQRDEFLVNELQKRHLNNILIVRSLKGKLSTVKEPFEYCELANILSTVSYGCASPSEDELMKIKDLFAKSPYNLQSLSNRHIRLLSSMHGLPYRFSKRLKLKEHANLIQHMDYAIEREGGVHKIPLETLQRACAVRGLNPVSMNKQGLVLWLKKWLAITTAIQEQHMSLLLHLPLFLAFNHPNNWKLYISAETGSKTKCL